MRGSFSQKYVKIDQGLGEDTYSRHVIPDPVCIRFGHIS